MKILFRYILISFILLVNTEPTSACLNEYRTLLNGEVLFEEGDEAFPRGRYNDSNRERLLIQLSKAESIYNNSGKINDYSDYGALLVYTGQFEKARKIFLEIENKSPGRYQTAANLGTTYELLGQNDSALYWIKRAVELNPESHEGSEWIHVKILEAKVKSNGDEKYLWSNNILGLNFGSDKIPFNKNKRSARVLWKNLYHQLNERMSFVKPKDPVVGQMLFDLGNVSAITSNVQSGIELFEKAREYGYNSDIMQIRDDYFRRLTPKADFQNFIAAHPYMILIIGFIVIIGLIFGLFYFLYSYFTR